MQIRNASLLAFSLIFLFSCGSGREGDSQAGYQPTSPEELEGLSTAYFGSGCFWCVEAIFESVQGVKEAVSGYAGGEEPDPTYAQVSAGRTGHAETVAVYYDSTAVSYSTLLKVFFGSHDPTTLNRQGPDRGPQYRSLILYTNANEKAAIDRYIATLQENHVFDEPITTEVKPLDHFWKAEAYHQDYERRNPNDSYIRNVSIPRLEKFREAYPEVLRDDLR